MFILRDGGMRFNALLRGVEGISQKVLASTLKELERDGYINREVINTSPPSVEYSLTSMGKDFLRMLTTVSAWVESNWQAMEDSRRDYDLRSKSSEQGSADLFQGSPSKQLQAMP
jgi:DNA-binding HxlR family transcriptional regulator